MIAGHISQERTLGTPHFRGKVVLGPFGTYGRSVTRHQSFPLGSLGRLPHGVVMHGAVPRRLPAVPLGAVAVVRAVVQKMVAGDVPHW